MERMIAHSEGSLAERSAQHPVPSSLCVTAQVPEDVCGDTEREQAAERQSSSGKRGAKRLKIAHPIHITTTPQISRAPKLARVG